MSRKRGLDRRAFLRNAGATALLGAVGAIFTLSLVLVIERTTHFHADDIGHFLKLGDRSFADFALTPIDVHLAPLHRACTLLIFEFSRLDFRVGLAVLLALHAAAVFLLWKTLRLLGDNPGHAVLIFLYATNVLLFVPLSWWSSGIHRFPYILLSIGCIHLVLRERAAPSAWNLLGAAACFVAALGFYVKAALIPAYLLGLEVCLDTASGRRPRARSIAFLAVLSAVGIAYVAATGSVVSDRFTFVHLDWQTLVLAEAYGFSVLGAAVLGFAEPGAAAKLATTVAWLGFLLYTVAKRPSDLAVWLIGAGLVALNILAIALSNRTLFGAESIATQRYYFELMFLVVLFAAPLLRERPESGLGVRFPPRSTARTTAQVAGIVLALGYASLYFAQGAAALREDRDRAMAKEFMDNLIEGMAQLQAAPPPDLSFVDGGVPKYVHWVGAFRNQPYSRFLQLFEIDATFDDYRSANLYRITDTGKLVRVKTKFRRGRDAERSP